MSKKSDKDKEKEAFNKLMAGLSSSNAEVTSVGTTGSSTSSAQSASSSTSSSASSSSSGGKGKKQDAFSKLMAGLTPSPEMTEKGKFYTDDDSAKASRKKKRRAFWQGVGKNVRAGMTDNSLKNQMHYYAHNDPLSEEDKYLYGRTFSGPNTDFTTERSLNPAYYASRIQDRLLDPNRRVGRESNQGTIYTQADAERDIQALDEYRARQDALDYEADVATQNAFDVIDPDTKIGELALSTSMALARTAPSLAKDAAITAMSGGLLGPEMAAAGFSKFAIRLASELPTLTVRTVRYYDDAFQNALDNGATQEQAVSAALQTALPNAAIESAGGLDALAAKVGGTVGKTVAKTAASTAARTGNKLVRYLGRVGKTGLEEGLEESAQGIVERGAAHRTYDEDAVAFDVQKIVNDFALGAAGGIILGGVLDIVHTRQNAGSDITEQEIVDMVRSDTEAEGVPVSDYEASQIGKQIFAALQKRAATPEQAAERISRYETQLSQNKTSQLEQTLDDIAEQERARSAYADPVTGELIGADGKPVRVAVVSDEQKAAVQQARAMIEAQDENSLAAELISKYRNDTELTEAERFAAVILARSADEDTAVILRQAAGHYTRSDADATHAPAEDDFRRAEAEILQQGNDQFFRDLGLEAAGSTVEEKAQSIVDKVDNGQVLTVDEAAYLGALARRRYQGNGWDLLPDRLWQQVAQAIAVNNERRMGNLGLTNEAQTETIIPVSETETVQKSAVEEPGRNAVNPSQETIMPVAGENAAEGLASGENGTGKAVPVELGRKNHGLIVPEGAGEEQNYQFTENSLHNAVEAGIVDEQVESDLSSDVYATVHNEQSLAQAQAAIDKNGVDAIEQHLLRVDRSSKNMNSTEYAAALTLIKQFSNAGEYDRASTMAEVARNASNDAGRLLQLTKTIMRSSPELYVIHATRQLRKSGVAISESRQELLRAIAEAAQKAEKGNWDGTIDLSRVKTINAPQGVGIVANPVEPDIKEDPGVTEEEKAGIEQIERNIKAKDNSGGSIVEKSTGRSEADWLTMLGAAVQARPVNAGFGEFVTSWRRIAMLLNPKTLVVRNVGGNAFNLGTEMGTDPSAALVAQALKKVTGGEVSAVQAGQLKAAGRGFIHGFNTAWFAYRNGLLDQLGGNKYTNDSASQGRLFGSNETWPARVYRGLNSFVSFGLTALDQCFSQARQEQVLAQYQHAMEGNPLTEEQKALAEEAGKYVTFQNDSALAWLAVTLRGLGEKAQAKAEKDNWGMGGRTAAGLLNAILKLEIPFAKTPGNILTAALNLTPLSFANSILEITDEAIGQKTLKNMSLTRQRRIATGIGRSLTGAALAATGILLHNRGAMSGDTPDDEMEESIWAMLGKIPHSIKVGDNWWDMSSLGPSFVLLNLGATLADELKDELDTGSILKLFKTCVFQSTSEVMSDVTGDNLWSGVLDLAENIKNIKDDGLAPLVADIAGDAVSQIVPFSSALRQFAYTLDEYVRETSADTESGWIINKQKAGIPFLSGTLPEKIGVTGEEVVRYPNAKTGFGRAVNAFLNPASTVSADRSGEDWLQELVFLARETDDDSLLLEKAPYSLNGADGKYKLFGEERSLYQQTRTAEINQYLTELLGEDWYTGLPIDEQADLVGKLMDIADYHAKEKIDSISPDYSVKETETGSKLQARIDRAAAAGIDTITYLISDAATDGINAKDENGNSISGLGKARKAIAIRRALPDALPKQTYYLWKIQGGSNDFADHDGFYKAFFEGKYSDEQALKHL